ncbi:MAG: alpha/beta hydrolase-fold protein, partial [candidate division KSB1 bacterium]|nr:alpha/beta hydrolase-fold protein [candidate division KSB1 bacterium]
EVQILYTQIDRDRKNKPSFRSHAYRVNSKEYFYPASTVKFPAAVLALEKINRLGIPRLNKFTSLRIDSAASGQTSVTHDSSAENNLPSIAHYIKKIFLVSDNDAYNRLYEFLGQRELNEALWKKGYKDVRLVHRLAIARSAEQNRATNPFTFFEDDEIIYQQPLVINPVIFKNKLKTTQRGSGYIQGDSLINQPKDFSGNNYFGIATQQEMLKAVMFPEAVSAKQRFQLTEEDYRFLYKYMSMLPRESAYPEYDPTEYDDSYVKFFLFGDSKQPIPPHIRIFNKVGQAYGYLSDNAYIVDFDNKIEFLLTAVIYVNEDGILNDDNYEYDTVGLPFLANLGRVIYEYEKSRPRQYVPNLEKFKCDYFEPRKNAYVTFKIVTPPSTPDSAKVFIAGNQAVLGDWDPGKIALQKQNDSLWTISRKFPKGLLVEFKITRGSWQTEAIYQVGVVPTNTTFTALSDTTITFRPLMWRDQMSASITPGLGAGITGTVNYFHGVKSPKLRHPREVIVWLPPSYEKSKTRRYPVLYMHDGQNVFDPRTSFLGQDWRVDEIADSLIRANKMEEVIVVAIYNSPDRTLEYSDSELGRAYIDFLVNELKPMIDRTYRTKPEAKNTAVMGSSMGGLISFLCVWQRPDVFSQAGCLSSAFLWNDNKILREVGTDSSAKKPIRLYLDVGSSGVEARLKPGYEEMVKLLEAKGYKRGVDLEYFYDEGAAHNELAWAKRLWRPLLFMFGK